MKHIKHDVKLMQQTSSHDYTAEKESLIISPGENDEIAQFPFYENIHERQ